MSISQSAIALLYLGALILGACLGLFYDALRITRIFLGAHYSNRAVTRLHSAELPLIGRHREHPVRAALGIVVFIEDILFFIVAGAAMILLFYELYNGKIRVPALLLSAVGFGVYRATAGKLVMLFSEAIAFVLESAVRYLFFFLLFPIRWLYKKLSGVFRKTVMRAQNKAWAKERERYTEQELREAERSAGGLFPHEGKKGTERRNAKGKEKAVQSEPVGEGVSGGHDRRIPRGVRQQRDALQRAPQRTAKAGRK